MGSSMIAIDIRTYTQLIDGVEYTGWTIYKHIMEKQYNRSRRGIDSYMRDLLHIFNWAYEEEYITKRVMRKSDRYKKHELKPLEYKVWSNEEIKYLFHHPHLSAEQKDIAYLFAITGARANELVGHNMRKPYKELHWEHIDFINNTMLLLQKRRKTRETVAVHPSAISILKRIFRTGADRPLDINYLKGNPKKMTLAKLLWKTKALNEDEIYKKLNLKDSNQDLLIEKISKNPILLERPIVVKGKKAIIGRPPENVKKLL